MMSTSISMISRRVRVPGSAPLVVFVLTLLAGAGATALADGKPAPAAVPSVKLLLPARAFPAGSETVLEVHNLTGSPIFLPGCASYWLEQLVEDRYVPLPARRCVWEENAREVPPGTHSLALRLPEGGRAMLRVGVTYGSACRTGRPLSSAECRSVQTAFTSAFTVLEAAAP